MDSIKDLADMVRGEQSPCPIVTAPSHTRTAFDISTLPLIVNWAETICLRHRADAVMVCGHSGLIVAGALSYVMRIPVLAARKLGEVANCKASRNRVSAVVERKARRWVWLDDLIASGGTFRDSVRMCWNEGLLDTPVPVAVLQYIRYGGQDNTEPSNTFDMTEYGVGAHRGLGLLAEFPDEVSADIEVPAYGFERV